VPDVRRITQNAKSLFCAGAIGGVEWCSWHTSSSGHTSVAMGPVEWPSTIEVDGLVLVMLICKWWHLWRHLDDICGLYQLVDNLWWYLWTIWYLWTTCDDICHGYGLYVMAVWYMWLLCDMWWLCDICMCGCNKQKKYKKANFPAMPSAITKTLGKAGKFAEWYGHCTRQRQGGFVECYRHCTRQRQRGFAECHQ